MSLFAELRRRNVIRMAGLYLVAAWVIVQVAETVLPTFEVPAWVLRAIIIVIALGFFPALIFAWVFELTPEGLKRDAEVDRSRSIASRTGQRMNVMIGVLLVLALTYLVLDRFVLAPSRSAVPQVAGPASETTDATPVAAKAASPIAAKSIAVLPFENLSADRDNDYFASGMQDMILTKLVGIGDLKVISRTSTQKYTSRPDNLRTVAQELGVATILEGSVQKSGNAVLINVQLIDAASDSHLWAEAYQRTLDNLFGVEGEVAQKIADALKAKLTSAESLSVARVATRNPAAYDAFLKAEYQYEQARESWNTEDYRNAEAGYREAIALDPDYALAYARLAYGMLTRHWFSTGLSDEEMASAKAAIERALALEPDLPEAHLAQGFYDYWGFRRYDAATVQFERTLALAPNNVQAINGLGYIARRTGKVEQALDYFEKALTLSPREAETTSSLGETYAMLRRYAKADQYLSRALAIAPDDANSKDLLLQVRLFGSGDSTAAREILRQPPDWRFDAMRRWGGDVYFVVNPRVYPDLMDRRFDAAVRAWDAAPVVTDEDRLAARVARVVIRIVAGDAAPPVAECRELDAQVRDGLRSQPESLGLLQLASWIDVCLGRRAEAVATAEKAVALLPLSKDGYFGTNQLSGLAQIAAHAGATDRALEVIRQLLTMPAGTLMSIGRLERDPVWDPLRQDPRFQALLKPGSQETEDAAHG